MESDVVLLRLSRLLAEEELGQRIGGVVAGCQWLAGVSLFQSWGGD